MNVRGQGTPFYRSGEFGKQRPLLQAWTTNPLRLSSASHVWVCVVGANAGDVNRGADGAIGRSVAAVVPSSSIDSRYLFYCLKNSEPWLRNRSAGSVQAVLSKNDLGELEIPLPSLEEQIAIATTLATLDSKIESNESIRRLVSQLLDSLALDLDRRVPKVPLSEIATFPRSTVNPTKLGDELLDHYSLPAFDLGGIPEKTPAHGILSSKLAVSQPSILFSRLNPKFDRTWWAVPESDTLAVASGEYAVITGKSLIETAGLWLAIRSRSFRETVEGRVSGTSGSHQRIRTADLLTALAPDTRLLDDAERMRTLQLLNRERAATFENSKLASLRDSLMSALISGHTRSLGYSVE